MGIERNLSTFAGLPVVTVEGDEQGNATFPEQSGPVAWRSTFDYEAEGDVNALQTAWFNQVPDPEHVQALLLGLWAIPYDNVAPVPALVAAAERFPALKHLFIAEVVYTENEISWIQLGDLSPVIDVWGNRLETLRIRGSQDLRISPFTSETLTELAIETGGLPCQVPQALAASTLPTLRHLEIWFGMPEYGLDTTPADTEALLANPSLGAVRHVGLRNLNRPLDHLTVLATSPLLRQLTTLDISLGVVGDECVELLTSGPFSHLRTIDITHHYLTDEGMAALVAGLPDTELFLDEQEEQDDPRRPDEDPYDLRWVAVSE